MADTDPDLDLVLDNISADVEGNYTYIDPDTVDKSGHRLRLQGVDAAETDKLKYGPDGQIEFTGGTEGYQQANPLLEEQLRKKGFTNVRELEEAAAFGRGTYQLRATGEGDARLGDNATSYLIRTGAIAPNKYTRPEDLEALRVSEILGDQLKINDNEQDKQFAEQMNAFMGRGYGDEVKIKEQALSEEEYAANKDLYSKALQFREGDRNLEGDAISPVMEAWDVGMTGLKESAYGALQLFGDVVDSQYLQELGSDGAVRVAARRGEFANFISDYKDVDSFGDAAEFLGTNLAMSLPYMAGIMGATAAGAISAPLGAVGLGGVASIYAGQVYNEQPDDNKNATAAIASGILQAGLDRLGIETIFKVGTPKELFKQATDAVMKKHGVSAKEAAAIVSNASRAEIAGLAGDALKIAKDQITKKRVFVDTMNRVASAGAGEAVTEAMQETIGYLGAHAHTGDIDFGEIQERAIHAAIAGGSLGGLFGAPGAVHDKIMWKDVEWQKNNAGIDDESEAGKLAQDEEKYWNEQGLDVPSVDQLTENAADLAQEYKDTSQENFDEFEVEVLDGGLNAFENIQKKHRKDWTLADKIMNAAGNPFALFKGHLDNIFSGELKSKSRAIRELSGMFGGGLQRIYSGSTFANFKMNMLSKYTNTIPDPKKFYEHFGVGEFDRTGKQKISKDIYDTLNNAAYKDKDGFNPNLIPDSNPNKQVYIKLGNDLNALAREMHTDQKKYNPKLGKLNNYLLKYKAFDKKQIEANRAEFIQKLLDLNVSMDGRKMTRNDASRITDAILDNDTINDLDEAIEFSVTRGTPQPGSHKKRSLGLSERAEFQKFMDQDLFENVKKAASAAARYQAYQKYVGTNGEKVTALLLKARQEGATDAEIATLGKGINDYLNAESGNYKRPTTKAGKTLLKIQKDFTFITTITSLLTATVSSLPELAMITKGLTKEDLFGKDGKGGLRGMAEEQAKEINKIMDDAISKKDVDVMYEEMKRERSDGMQILKDVGLLSWDVGAATTTGVTEVSKMKENMIKGFFKANGLSKYTDFTRAVRASFAGDHIMNNLVIVLKHPADAPLTREVMQAKERLRNLGLPTDKKRLANITKSMSRPDLVSEKELVEAEGYIRDATLNFINDAIALPDAGNRPLFYSDPRFALFTQFQGFIATITANHIPKLWGEYVKRGSPAMKYNAFATMVTMIALGFLSQAIKDSLKFGLGEENPYLDDAQYIRRGIESSGLLGTAQRITDTLFPMYEERSRGPAEWAWNQIKGQSPALSKTEPFTDFAGAVIEGDTDTLPEKTLKLGGVPKATGREIVEFVSNPWNYIKE